MSRIFVIALIVVLLSVCACAYEGRLPEQTEEVVLPDQILKSDREYSYWEAFYCIYPDCVIVQGNTREGKIREGDKLGCPEWIDKSVPNYNPGVDRYATLKVERVYLWEGSCVVYEIP